mmetsp:Transcript_2619/g.5794  ORF Transcript_2619/g.5794 Transcript_2619/m.5794 type:complete len:184 (+) Transcript_2619:792-1343(+)
MPEPLGPEVQTSCYVDANHAGNVVTRRSHTGINWFLNRSPITSVSRRQNTCEAATFNAELVALRTARDLTAALRLKLKSFGVRLQGPTDRHCDNQGSVAMSWFQSPPYRRSVEMSWFQSPPYRRNTEETQYNQLSRGERGRRDGNDKGVQRGHDNEQCRRAYEADALRQEGQTVRLPPDQVDT